MPGPEYLIRLNEARDSEIAEIEAERNRRIIEVGERYQRAVEFLKKQQI